jgi:hypothetical protein
VRLREKIGVAFDDSAPGPEDRRFHTERRWIDVLREEDVADIARIQIQAGQAERFFRVLIDIGERSVPDRQVVDLEGINRLHRLLPAVLLERYGTGGLGAILPQVDPDFRPFELDFRDDLSAEDLPPMDVELKNRKTGDRRIRIFLLENGQPFQGQR